MRITAYDATGKQLDQRDAFTLGTRVLLICDVTELQGHEVVSYRWFRNCTGGMHGRCQIHDRDPYYRVVDDTLLVDVTSWDQGGKYSCFLKFSNKSDSSYHLSNINVAGQCIHHNAVDKNILRHLTPLVPTQVTLFPSYTPPSPSSLSTPSSLMYNRQQGELDNSG